MRKFVSEFYNWYATLLPQQFKGFTADEALRRRPYAFDAELTSLLRRTFDAQAQCSELIGIDWDPIGGSQDPPERFEVGRIYNSKQGYRAEVYGYDATVRRDRPVVVAEVAQLNGQWVFVDFFCPDCGSLADYLRQPPLPCNDRRVKKKK